VAELGFGVIANIDLHLRPVPFIIANLLARCTDGQQAAQDSHIGQRLLAFLDGAFALFVARASFDSQQGRHPDGK
jgi:hypothetical protein